MRKVSAPGSIQSTSELVQEEDEEERQESPAMTESYGSSHGSADDIPLLSFVTTKIKRNVAL